MVNLVRILNRRTIKTLMKQIIQKVVKVRSDDPKLNLTSSAVILNGYLIDITMSDSVFSVRIIDDIYFWTIFRKKCRYSFTNFVSSLKEWLLLMFYDNDYNLTKMAQHYSVKRFCYLKDINSRRLTMLQRKVIENEYLGIRCY